MTYTPKPVAELSTGTTTCVPGGEHETSVSLECTFVGEVDPWGVAETQVSFQWGRTPSLGEVTVPATPVANVKSEGEEEPLVDVSAPIQARPNETFYDRVAGEDRNVKSPEQLAGAIVPFSTPLVAPKVVGVPSASFVKDASAVLFAELNPENASTEYLFEYAPEPSSGEDPLSGCAQPLGVVGAPHAGCVGVQDTSGAISSVYGRIATTMEATGLQPGTTYRYRLAASDEREASGKLQGGEAAGAEGRFTTAPAPVPGVQTGSAVVLGASGATVSGTVDPGWSAGYLCV